MNHIFSTIRTQFHHITSARSESPRLTRGDSTSAISSPLTHTSDQTINILITAVWFGLVTGLIEGVGLVTLRELGWLPWRTEALVISPKSIWISPLFDLLLFGLLGLALGLLARLLTRLPVMLFCVFVFATMMFFNWLSLPLLGRISLYAILALAIGLAAEAARWFRKYPAAVVHFWRRSVPWLGAITLLALVGIQGGPWLYEQMAISRLPQIVPSSPNILVIVVDTLRADHLSSYGYSRLTSPNVDRLAQRGVLFENAISASSWTQPSHASLLTGRYTYEHDAEVHPLDNHYPTIAEALSARGYRTAAFSANLLFFTRRQGFGRGFILFEDNYHTLAGMATNTIYGHIVEFYLVRRILGFEGVIARKFAPDINDTALRWIDRHPGHPFFVFLNYFDAHDPYLPPQPYRSKFSKIENPGGLINTYLERFYPQMTPDQLQSEIDAYDGAIAYTDDYIGQLLAELQKRGLADNTLVVFTSDHGESFGEHGILQHGSSLYLEQIHVPLIFWWPGHVPEGERVAQPVTNSALPATLLDLIGEQEQTLFPGPSLTQLWNAPDAYPDWPNPLSELAQFPGMPANEPAAQGAMKSVVSPQWHYIVHEKFGEELYDWPIDPQESENLVKNQEFQSVVGSFRMQIETLLAGVTDLSK
jgi:arylsulfatase A-like enzyme